MQMDNYYKKVLICLHYIPFMALFGLTVIYGESLQTELFVLHQLVHSIGSIDSHLFAHVLIGGNTRETIPIARRVSEHDNSTAHAYVIGLEEIDVRRNKK